MHRIFLPLLLAVTLASCYDDKKDKLYPTAGGNGGGTCDTAGVTYSGTVSKIMTQSCALSGCHNAATASSGVVLDSHTGVKNATSAGRLVGAIRHSAGYIAMPQAAPKLDDCSIAKIAAWVSAGALDN